MRLATFAAATLLCVSAVAHQASAVAILSPGDAIIAIDTDGLVSNSSYPGGEAPSFAVDGSLAKYLNFAGPGSGFIVTPQLGSSTVQSMLLTTANDAAGRDPGSFALYGTNDAIVSLDNSTGLGESWTLIDGYDLTGAFDLPAARDTVGPVIPLTNGSAYTSYKLIFPTTSGDNLMQIAEVSLFESGDGTGSDWLNSGDTIIAVHEAQDSRYPGGEPPSNLIDGTLAKYLNFGQVNSGFIVTPAVGAEVLKTFEITTANDAEERDPMAFEVYGTNDPIVSTDNTVGDAEAWTLIDTGMISLPSDRDTSGTFVKVDNDTAYSSYKMIFTDLKDAGAANSMQIAEIQFYNISIPEPTAVGLALVSCLGLGIGRGRRS